MHYAIKTKIRTCRCSSKLAACRVQQYCKVVDIFLKAPDAIFFWWCKEKLPFLMLTINRMKLSFRPIMPIEKEKKEQGQEIK